MSDDPATSPAGDDTPPSIEDLNRVFISRLIELLKGDDPPANLFKEARETLNAAGMLNLSEQERASLRAGAEAARRRVPGFPRN